MKSFKTLFLTMSLVVASPAGASTITPFLGQDNGASPNGTFTNSNTAHTSFVAAASVFGPVSVHGVGAQPVGSSSGIWFNGDGNWALTGDCCVSSFSGVTNTQTGSPTDGFQTFSNGSGNTKWLGVVNGSVIFNNTLPTNSFGAYFSGLTSGTIL